MKFIKMSNVDKVVLDVGGVIFHTRKSTLINSAHPSAFFESLLSNEEDVYFIDRDPNSFAIILNFLRQNNLNLHIYDAYILDFLLSEAQFFNLQNLQSELMLQRLNDHTFASDPNKKTHGNRRASKQLNSDSYRL